MDGRTLSESGNDLDLSISVKKNHWRFYVNKLIAQEVSSISRYFNKIIQWNRRKDDSGILLNAIECPEKILIESNYNFPNLSEEKETQTAVFINGNFNYSFDIQNILQKLKPKLSRSSRVIVINYNSYFSFLYRIANWLGIRQGEQPETFLTRTDLSNIVKLSGYSIVRVRPVVYFPFKLFGIGSFLNKILPAIPFFRWFSLASVFTLKPLIEDHHKRPSLSIIIPARNEKGNIHNALERIPDLKTNVEIIFIEGHSTDGTWEEIQKACLLNNRDFKIKSFQQKGKGKNDAVRLGFSHATGDLLTILDADLTMPPELLIRFYDAYCLGLADFINGTRLIYPMEGQAMRFLNRLGNIFFSKAVSFVLETNLGDCLCGTKLLSRSDYQRMIKWRNDFGDVDPFGDFELLFPAAQLGLGVVDIPIRYLARTYGTTNIHRFRHGLILFKMTIIGLFKIRMGK